MDGNNLGVEVGDIVSVRLKGRQLNGLVIREIASKNEDDIKFDNYKILSIEEIIQKKVIQDWWREWIEDLASFYKVSNTKMFKTAFPPGWIGKYKNVKKIQ